MSDDHTIEDVLAIMRLYGITAIGAGAHRPGGCEACTREITYLLRAPRSLSKADVLAGWTANPEGSPTDKACRTVSDGPWSPEARTEACLPLVLLRESDAQEGWVSIYTEATIRIIIPLALRLAGLDKAADRCEREGTEAAQAAALATWASREAAAARLTALWAAGAADRAGADAAASAALSAAALAAWHTDKRDAILRLGVAVLLSSHTHPRPWETPEVQEALSAVHH